LDPKRQALTLARAHVGDGDVHDLRVEHPWTGEIDGRVVDVGGRPVARAEGGAVAADVRANRSPSTPFAGALDARAGRTGSDGRFALARLPADRPLRLVVRAPGFASRFGDALSAPAHDVETPLLPESVLVGRVEDADGAEIAGASVRVGRYDPASYDSPVRQ